MLDKNLEKNEQFILNELKNNEDVISKQIKLANTSVSVIYVKNAINEDLLYKHVVGPITSKSNITEKNLLDEITINTITAGEIVKETEINRMLSLVLRGNALVLIDGESEAVLVPLTNQENRTVTEPPTASVLTGPREGFTEGYKTNISLIRKRLITKDLKIKSLEIGKYTKTKVSLLYLTSIADENIVNKIYKKLKKIDIDGIIDSYYLVNFLEERPGSIFKQVGQTEKPDVAVAKMLEGRVAIVVDGSPIILTLPFILVEDLQSPDDYYQKSFRVSFIRYTRLIGVLISVLLPGFYIAVELYHYKIIPLNLLVTLSNATANLPIGPLAEIILVIILFEILYEANMRMPRYLGMATSIVGALILGDTAVKAGLISPPAVMIVALSGITIYTIPNQAGQLSILRLAFTFAGALLSMYGIILLGLFLMLYLSNFNSYGAPYLAPVAPYIKEDLKDAVTKKNLLKLKNRPISIKNKDKVRLK